MKYAKCLKEMKPPDKNKLPYQDRTENYTLEEAEYLIDHLEDLFSTLPKEFSRDHIMCDLSELIVAFGLVHTTTCDDRDFSSEDFPDTAINAVECFKYLKILIEKLELQEYAYRRHFFIDVTLLIATHSETYHWSNKDSILACNNFLDFLLQHANHKNLSSLLCDEHFNPTIFKSVLKKMRPLLLKDTWMHNPSSCYMFHWLLNHVKHPHLADYLSDVFPPPFMFVSYHAVDQKVIGLKCFEHLLDNVPPSLMVLTGNEEAIFHSLHPLIYSKEIVVIDILFSCLFKLPMIKSKQKKLAFWDECSKIMNHLLHSTEFENDVQIKRLYLSHIRNFMVSDSPIKHLKYLIKIVKLVLVEDTISDKQCQIIALEILQNIIKCSWPRMEKYCFDILVSIISLLEKYGSPNDEDDEINRLSEKCLSLLKFSCYRKFMSLVSRFIDDSEMFGVKLLKKVMGKRDCCPMHCIS